MNPVVTVFVLYLITLPDVEREEHLVSRIVFDTQEECLHMADILQQPFDPWVGKRNCVEVDQYYKEMKLPLMKPEEIN